MGRVHDAGTKNQPCFPVGSKRDYLVAGAVDDGLIVSRCFQLVLDEFTAAPSNGADIDHGVGGLARQRREPAFGDALADTVIEDRFVEDPVVAFVEAAAVQAKSSCRTGH